jgi:hypothetical protein
MTFGPPLGDARAAVPAGPALGVSRGGRMRPSPLSNPLAAPDQEPTGDRRVIPAPLRRPARGPQSPERRCAATPLPTLPTLPAEQNPLKTPPLPVV